MWLVKATSKANGWSMLLPKAQRVSRAAGWVGKLQVGGLGEGGCAGYETADVFSAVGCSSPSEHVPAASGCRNSVEGSDHSPEH